MNKLILFLTLFASISSGEVRSEIKNTRTKNFLEQDYLIKVESKPFEPKIGNEVQLFSQKEASHLGINHANILTPDHFIPPYWNGRGIASGDIDNDGYIDLALASKNGVRLFLNQKGEFFKEVDIGIPEIIDKQVFVVALVDWNNDGWLDIFFTSYGKGNYWVKNEQGQFSNGLSAKLPGSPLMLTKALSFGDIDRDGDLDAALGNWFYGQHKHYPPADSDNYLLVNDKSGSTSKLLPGIVGETLSVLFSDFTMDGNIDLMVGNDFEPPDYFYLGNGKGEFEIVEKSWNMIPKSTNTTMSIDTADFDNDLDFDIYITQIAAGATGEAARVPLESWNHYCDVIETENIRTECKESVKQKFLVGFGPKFRPNFIENCELMRDEEEFKACVSVVLLEIAILTEKLDLCFKIPLPSTMNTCTKYFKPRKPVTVEEQEVAIPFVLNENVFLVSNDGKSFSDQAENLGVAITGWSWNSKFADFDNNEWQDIFVVNGTWIRDSGTPTKFYFENQGGEGFAEVVGEIGLQNYMIQSAFTEIDFDNDGDLDIFANSVSGPIWFYRNNEQRNNSVVFEFRDEIGNHFGVGNKVIISYGNLDGDQQVRELKSGGGFLSFNHPYVHFGLGDKSSIGKVEIHWSTGEVSILNEPFEVNNKYTVFRSGHSRYEKFDMNLIN